MLIVVIAINSISYDLNASNNESVLEINNSAPLDRPFMDGMVVFDSNMNGNWDIFSMEGTGNNLRQITFSPADERWPTVSSDGSHIAFSSNEDGYFNIVIQDLRGDRRFNLTHNGSNETQPDWGPWDQLLYVSDLHGNRDIFLKNIWGTPEDNGGGQSQGVQMTFTNNDETEPSFAGEEYGNIFAYKMIGNIWAMNMEDFRNWPVREGGEDERSPSFHPWGMIRDGNNRDHQPQFLFLKNDKLYYSNIGWQNNFSQEQLPLNFPGTLRHVAFSKDDPCTIAFTLKEGGKIGLANHCEPGSNSILLPDGNAKFGADKVAYARSSSGGFMGGMMGGMMPPSGGGGGGGMMGGMRDMMQMGDDMMKQEDERMRMQQERQQQEMEMERKRMEEQDRMNKDMMDSQMESERERSEMQMEADRERMNMERERTEMQMEADRARMEQEREMRDEQSRMQKEMMDEEMRMEQERMEQQRDMMKSMEGSGGRAVMEQAQERCFIEDEEQSRGLFGNIEIGSEIDCGNSESVTEKLQDPTNLAMLGLVVTVGATLLQMFRGN